MVLKDIVGTATTSVTVALGSTMNSFQINLEDTLVFLLGVVMILIMDCSGIGMLCLAYYQVVSLFHRETEVCFLIPNGIILYNRT